MQKPNFQNKDSLQKKETILKNYVSRNFGHTGSAKNKADPHTLSNMAKEESEEMLDLVIKDKDVKL